MAGAPVILDSPWGGTSYNPATPLDITTIETAIVTQLRSAIGNMVEVAHFPDRPESYRLTHRVGAAHVVYMGSRYGKAEGVPEIIDFVAQAREMEFLVRIIMRDLGWAYGGQPAGPSPGAYQVIEAVRIALMGFQPNTGCSKMVPKREQFIERDKEGGTWYYGISFVTRTLAVENYSQPAFPLLTKAQAFEEMGQTLRSVAAAAYTFNAQNLITLPNQNLSAVAVRNISSGAAYAAGVDYTLDAVNGIITRLATGSIPANAAVNVAFSYADVVTAVYPGGSAPFAPNN